MLWIQMVSGVLDLNSNSLMILFGATNLENKELQSELLFGGRKSNLKKRKSSTPLPSSGQAVKQIVLLFFSLGKFPFQKVSFLFPKQEKMWLIVGYWSFFADIQNINLHQGLFLSLIHKLIRVLFCFSKKS